MCHKSVCLKNLPNTTLAVPAIVQLRRSLGFTYFYARITVK
jgi:hypothetical protein